LCGLQTVSGAPDLLEIAAAQGGEILIPFVAEYLQEVDLEARRIRLRLPDGLLELNAPDRLPERS
jgi:16S rRNA processing protein RimM